MSAAPPDPRASLVVLLVEDEALIRMCAGEALADAGFTVTEAGHAHEAIEILERDHDAIRVVFTDVQMPGTVNGVGLAHHVRHHWPRIGLLIVSAQPRPALGELPAGARFLGKPYKLDHAVRHVRQLVTC